MIWRHRLGPVADGKLARVTCLTRAVRSVAALVPCSASCEASSEVMSGSPRHVPVSHTNGPLPRTAEPRVPPSAG